MHRVRSSQRESGSGIWIPAVAAGQSVVPDHQSSSVEAQKLLRREKGSKGIKTVLIRVLHTLANSRNLTFGIVLLLASTLCLASWVAWQYFLNSSGDLHNTRFTVYVDGGSSGTRVHVFQFKLASWPSYVKLKLPEVSFSIEPGLSHYVDDPDKAAASLIKLLDFAYGQVPESLWHVTPVHLLATAGLRLLGKEQSEAILMRCTSLLASSNFLFRSEWARVIAGDLEGLYGWAAVNYVSGALEEAAFHHHHSRKEILDPAMFDGVLEMGGASMQITFLPVPADELTERVGTRVGLPGVPSRLFTHSYLGLGMDSALEKAAALVLNQGGEKDEKYDPCLPLGYRAEDGRHGNATFLTCLAVAQQVVPLCAHSTSGTLSAAAHAAHIAGDKKTLLTDYTAHSLTDYRSELGPSKDHSRGVKSESLSSREGGSNCHGVAGVLLPPLTGKFIAMENFFWTAKALGLNHRATLQELHDAGRQYCSRHWSSLHAEFSGHIPDQFLMRYCFAAAYVFTLLHHGLGIGLDERLITYTNTIRDARSGSEVGLSWVVGAMLVEAMNTERHSTFHFLSRGADHAHGRYLGLFLPLVGAVSGACLLLLHCCSRIALKQPLKHPTIQHLLHDSPSVAELGDRPRRVPSFTTFIQMPGEK